LRGIGVPFADDVGEVSVELADGVALLDKLGLEEGVDDSVFLELLDGFVEIGIYACLLVIHGRASGIMMS
jgi:hypothetical protein